MRHYGYFLLLAVATRVISATQTPVTTTESISTPLATTTAAQSWGLTPEEWSRYEQLKRSERGIWSPALDPLTTLGVEATTDAARQKYAALLVEKEAQRVEKELAFQRAYDAAWKQRFPALSPVAAGSTSLTSTKEARLAVFVRENCPSCERQLSTLLAAGNPLDIYLVDSQGDDARLRRWSIAQHIDRARVQRRDITLNHDGGRWLLYGRGRMPAVLEKQGETWLPVTR